MKFDWLAHFHCLLSLKFGLLQRVTICPFVKIASYFHFENPPPHPTPTTRKLKKVESTKWTPVPMKPKDAHVSYSLPTSVCQPHVSSFILPRSTIQQLPLFISSDRSSCSWFHARLEIQNTPILCFFNWPNATVSQESHWITNSRESMQLKITQTSQRNSRSLHERERGGCCGGISTPPQYTPKLSHRIPQALQALLDTRLIGSVSE